MTSQSSLLLPLALAIGCSSMPSKGDMAMALDGGASDGGEGCVATQPPTSLYEDTCHGDGGMICYYDAPPTSFF